MNAEDATAYIEAYEEDPEPILDACSEGVAAAVPGVETEDAECYHVELSELRRLRSAPARRLSNAITVYYVIHLSAQEAYDANIDSAFISYQLTANGNTTIVAAYVSNSQGIVFNFTFTILSIVAPLPQEEVVEQERVPTVTFTATVTATTSTMTAMPLETEEEGAAAATAIIITALLLVVVCLVATVCRLRRQRKGEDPSQFYIVEADEKVDTTQLILWDLDAEGVKPERGPPPDAQPSEQTSDVAMVAADVLEEELATPVLPDGTPVEYYSRTHKRWLPGTLRVIVTPGTILREPEVAYNINVQTGGKLQVRENVTLDSFRAIFTEGDCVEVYSKSAKKWVPAIVDGFQTSPTLNGYKVQIEEGAGEHAGRVLEKVTPNRIRRRYIDGTLVSRYLGPSEGFCFGFVDRGADLEPEFDLGAALRGPAPSTASAYSNLSVSPPDGMEGWDKDLSSDGEDAPAAAADEICQWSSVKFREVECSTCVVVPTYLVFMVAEV